MAEASRKQGRMWLFVACLWMVAVCCYSAAEMGWTGLFGVHDATYDQSLRALRDGPNREAAIGRLQMLILAGMAAIEEHEGADGRQGMLARLANDHFQKQVKR